ncbi:MAG: hypothetical protein H6852_06395 [Geminicoccaceae bacterium]|nr:hypothetical protein [Geminicoccaceae bacterium]
MPSGKTLIQLFDKADLSTVLHETGHLFLEVMGDLATAENAPAALKAEYAKAPPLTRGSTPQAPRSRASTAGKPFRVQLSCPLDHRWRQMQRGRSAPEAMCT